MVPKALDQNCSDRSANVEELTAVVKDNDNDQSKPRGMHRINVGTVPGGQTPGRR